MFLQYYFTLLVYPHKAKHPETVCCRFQRVGAVVIFLHDPSDVFLELAKVCQYLGYELPAVCCFSLLLISWGMLRLVILPFWLIRSAV